MAKAYGRTLGVIGRQLKILPVVSATACVIGVSFSADARSPTIAPSAQVQKFASDASYSLCFVPDGPRCEDLILRAIQDTQKSLLIQAYSFTSAPIAEAVRDAHKRGVDVRVIVDQSQVSEKYTSARFLSNAGIPIVIDTKPAIAHNKVMIFDQTSVFTGSFNFTKSAQSRNAENGIIISGDAGIVRAYTDNWLTRQKKSSPY